MSDQVLDTTILPTSPTTPTSSTMANHPDRRTTLCLVYEFFQSHFALKNVELPLNASEFVDDTILQSSDYQRISEVLLTQGQEHAADSLHRITAQLETILTELHPPFGQQAFISLSRHFFNDGINWGLILTYFLFSSELAYQANLRGLATVADVAHWQVHYITEHLDPWIATNGGWNGIALHFPTEQEEAALTEQQQQEADHNLRFGLGAAALGVLSLGGALFLSSR